MDPNTPAQDPAAAPAPDAPVVGDDGAMPSTPPAMPPAEPVEDPAAPAPLSDPLPGGDVSGGGEATPPADPAV